MATGLNATYLYNKGFDQTKLREGIFNFLPQHQPGYAPTAAEHATTLINRLAVDPRVPDIRYMAYMLATACHESREIKKFMVPVIGKDKKPVIDAKTKQPLLKEKGLWTIFNPIDELGRGKGLGYFEPVKVLKTVDGALITEKDGDRFKVSAEGKILVETGFAKPKRRGSDSGGTVDKKFTDADGVEHQYFGRGLVQITWWDGYAESSAAFGYGLELLFNPEKVKEYDVAYEIMVQGMTTGGGYAHNKKCSMYFTDGKTDYAAARAMINGSDKAAEIAALAVAFETLLLAARLP
jgi:hypothetical protein